MILFWKSVNFWFPSLPKWRNRIFVSVWIRGKSRDYPASNTWLLSSFSLLFFQIYFFYYLTTIQSFLKNSPCDIRCFYTLFFNISTSPLIVKIVLFTIFLIFLKISYKLLTMSVFSKCFTNFQKTAPELPLWNPLVKPENERFYRNRSQKCFTNCLANFLKAKLHPCNFLFFNSLQKSEFGFRHLGSDGRQIFRIFSCRIAI